MLTVGLTLSPAYAKEQVVQSMVTNQKVTPGTPVSLTWLYATANPEDALLPGLGLRLHYDTKKLTFNGFDRIYQSRSTFMDTHPSGLVGVDLAPMDDSLNADNDHSTDKMVGLAWASLGGTWPGADIRGSMPLFTVNFQVVDGFSGNTVVRLVPTSTAVGYTFFSTYAILSLSGTFAVLDVDHNGMTDATDGVMIWRRLNAASTIDTGLKLSNGQTNASVISTIDAVRLSMDVDHSGDVNGTDGVLILRRLNGASTIDTGVLLPSGQSNETVVTEIDRMKQQGL